MSNSESHFLSEYLDRGYSEIYVVDQSWTEKKDWHATEIADESAVARKGAKFYSLSGHSVTEFNVRGIRSTHINQSEITEDEYLSLKAAAGAFRADSDEESAKHRNLVAERMKVESLRNQLLSTAPDCPEHSKRMVLKRGPKAYFWGCPQYPRCTAIEWLTPDQKQLAAQLSTLPHSEHSS